MFRRIALVAAVFLAACGTEKAPVDEGGNSGSEPGKSIPVAAFTNGASVVTAKIAAKTMTQVFEPTTDYDAARDAVVAVTCGNDLCPTGANAACQNNICGLIVDRPTLFFVKNVPAADGSFKLPCDNRNYTVEIYGGSATSQVLESHVATFAMTNCATAVTPTWTSKDFVADATLAGISYTVPEIYMGMEAPNNSFAVAVNGIAYPWTNNGWTLVASPALTGSTQGNLASFIVPTTMSAPSSFGFTGTFFLDPSLSVGSDKWSIQVTTSKTPVSAGTVNLP